MENCGDHYFNFIDQNQVNMFGINTLICPTSLNYSLHGDFYSKDFKYIEIRLQKCLNSTKPNATVCADENTINSFLDPLQFSMAFVNTYFDFNDYVNPIHYFIDDSFFFQLEPLIHKEANFFI